MAQINSEIETLISELVQEIYGYRRDLLEEGLYVTARDLDQHLNQKPRSERHGFDETIDDIMATQPDWVHQKLEETDIPDGFAQSAEQYEVDLVDFDDPAVDHEFMLYPGQEIFEECARGYYHIICHDRGIRGTSGWLSGSDEEATRALAIHLFVYLSIGSSWLPFLIVFAALVVNKGAERICSEYEPSTK